MTHEEVIEMIKSGRFENEYGFDLQILVNAVGALGDMLRNGYTIAPPPRVMTQVDVNNIGPEDVCAFVEIMEETHMYACYMRQYDETHTEIMCDVPDLPTKLQNGCARIWTSRPDEKVRAETPWQG